MGVFLNYIFLGLSLAAPIGPINAAQMDKGIKYGFWHAWLVGLGATIADAIYMMLVYLGLVHFINTPFMKTFLFMFGCFVLIYTGVESLVSSGKIVTNNRGTDESRFKCFLSGFLMSLSNPLTILFWLGIYGSVLAKTAASYAPAELLLYSGAIFLGILIWDVTMALIASSFRRFLAGHFLRLTSVISGLSLIGFGIYFGIQAFYMLTR